MDLDKMTIGDAKALIARGKELEAMFGGGQYAAQPVAAESRPYKIGQAYLVETVTKYYLGRLVWVGPLELVIEDASWIADTGRYSDALHNCTANEVEPCPDGEVVIGRGSIVSVVPWSGALLRDVK